MVPAVPIGRDLLRATAKSLDQVGLTNKLQHTGRAQQQCSKRYMTLQSNRAYRCCVHVLFLYYAVRMFSLVHNSIICRNCLVVRA
eukprot:3004-Heterococcus_DN1.PRE.1